MWGDDMKTRYFDHLNDFVKDIWYKQASTYENYNQRYAKRKDKALRVLDKKLRHVMKTLDINHIEDETAESLMTEIKAFAVDILGMSTFAVDQIFKREYFKFSQDFMKRARQVEPNLEREGIFQALRNVWVMHSMQMYFDLEVELTDAVFAYSMLYPLTDNLLDDKTLTKEDKARFNKRLGKKIMTGQVTAESDAEDKVYQMIDLIDGQWPREKYPKVFESLMGILIGQHDSLHQQGMASLFDKDLLSITFYKGGTSVLADAYLVKGSLTRHEEEFAFTYGVILQLADDIQDAKEDLEDGHFTMMNVQASLGHLDVILHKYLNLIDYFMTVLYRQDHKSQQALKELSYESIQLLIFEALMKSKRYISNKVYQKVCMGSHFSSKTYKKVERSFNSQLKGLIEAL